MKKLLLIFLSLTIFLNFSCYAMPFRDVRYGTEEYSAIEKLWSYGYVNGYNENSFAPKNNLTRAEFVKIINNVFSYEHEAANPFIDINPDDWYYREILKAVQADYISGMGDGRFCPEEKITREQVCVIINNILNMEMIPVSVYINDAVSDWAEDSVKKAVSNGLVSLEDGGIFRALEPITRGEAAIMLAKCVIDKPDVIEPINLEDLTEEVLVKRMSAIIDSLKNIVLPLCYLEEQTKVVEAIIFSMGEYLKDRNYDYKKAKDDTFVIYASMEIRDDRLALQNMITENLNLEDLVILYDFFFPADTGDN